jgi:hypothetical protein
VSARAVLYGGRLDGLEHMVPSGPDGLPAPLLLAPGDPLLPPKPGSTLVSILRYRRVRLVAVVNGEELWLYELMKTSTSTTTTKD